MLGWEGDRIEGIGRDRRDEETGVFSSRFRSKRQVIFNILLDIVQYP